MLYKRLLLDDVNSAYHRFNWQNPSPANQQKGKLYEFRVELFKTYCATRNTKEAALKMIYSEDLRKSLIRFEENRYEMAELLELSDEYIPLYNMEDLNEEDMSTLALDYEEHCTMVEINVVCGQDIVILRKFKRVIIENGMDKELNQKLKHLTVYNMEDVFEELSIPLYEVKKITQGRPFSFYLRYS